MSEITPSDTRQQSEFQEKILREELRSLRESILRTIQWGVTLLASLQTAIFFIRQSSLHQYIAINHLSKDSGIGLPIYMYLIGTMFLLMIAFICQKIVATLASRYVNYSRQLSEMSLPSEIKEEPLRMSMRWYVRALFYLFPLFDILLKIYISKISIVFKFM